MILTKEQRKALYDLYKQNNDGFISYSNFRRTASLGLGGDYVSVFWCGMYVGIEKDGYTHT